MRHLTLGQIMENTITRNIGENRNNRRVWLEGKYLADAGWNKGTRYQREQTADGFILTKMDGGKLKIAGGENRPVIDICGGYVAKALQGFEKVSVTIASDKITIKGASAISALLTLAA